MPETSTPDRIRRVIVEQLRLEDTDPASIGDDAPLFGPEGLGLDSVDALELVVALEKEFGVRIEDRDVDQESLSSVRRLAEMIESLRPGSR